MDERLVRPFVAPLGVGDANLVQVGNEQAHPLDKSNKLVRWKEPGVWAHSINDAGQRHDLADHLRSTAELARRFASSFGAGDLAWALGLLHDAGKADCGWQQRLLAVEGTSRPVGGDHKSLGARMLVNRAGPVSMAVLGHHGGLSDLGELRKARNRPPEPDEALTRAALLDLVPEAADLLAGGSLIPDAWSECRYTLEMGLRLVFSALVDADHLDTAAHRAGHGAPQVRPLVDMNLLAARFEAGRVAMLAGRERSPIDEVRGELYREAVAAADCGPGLFRLPAPTGSGKTLTAAGFALHHAARNGQSRVIVAVPFTTITEQNAQVYRELLGSDDVLEHHSNVEFDDRRAKLAAENWDAPFVVTTTVQLFDSLFGRKPARSRKVHRLANAVIVLDEVQALPISLLTPILDALRVLTENFGTTVLLASATQPAFEYLAVWQQQEITPVVRDPAPVYERLRRVAYEWWHDPGLSMADVARRVAGERQALVVVNTTADARDMHSMLAAESGAPVFHLSTRMCPAHRREVLDAVRTRLAADEPVLLVSTQLIEAGVDVDFPAVYRAYAPAESLQQAAGRANREGRRAERGRVVVFTAQDANRPKDYKTAVGVTSFYFGDGKADPDDLTALADYYRHLYNSLEADRGERARKIQERRWELDFLSVADGPLVNAGSGTQRDRGLAFRMIDDDSVPVVVTKWAAATDVAELVDQLRREPTRDVFRALHPYVVALPRYVVNKPDVDALTRPVLAGVDLREWRGDYDSAVGINDRATVTQEVW